MSAIDNIQLIQSVFQEAQNYASKENDRKAILSHLNKIKHAFTSVAYEGTSFILAERSIKNNNSLKDWEYFLKETKGLHDSQIHVGLGWAIAAINADLNLYTQKITPLLYSRVLDGYGYYYAIFKRRIAIRSAQIPNNIRPDQVSAFNQGIGRSLWYLAEGKIEKLTRLIQLIQSERHGDLWRGIGIAYTYVGGEPIESIERINLLSGEYNKEFLCGIALALYARNKSGLTLTSSTLIGSHLLKDQNLAVNTISEFNESDSYLKLIHSLKQVV